MDENSSPDHDDHEARVRALREALEAAERSGPPTPFDFDEFLARKRAEYFQDE